jgi:hypothetical protein
MKETAVLTVRFGDEEVPLCKEIRDQSSKATAAEYLDGLDEAFSQNRRKRRE